MNFFVTLVERRIRSQVEDQIWMCLRQRIACALQDHIWDQLWEPARIQVYDEVELATREQLNREASDESI